MTGRPQAGLGQGAAQASSGTPLAAAVSDAIGLLYDAGFGKIGWSAPLVHVLDVTDSDAGVICWRHLEGPDGGIIAAGQRDGDAPAIEAGPDDLDLSRLDALGDAFFIPRRENGGDSPYRAGAVHFRHRALGLIHRGSGLLVFIELLRRKDRPAFESRHLASHAALLEHLRRAWLIRAVLRRTGLSAAVADWLEAEDVFGAGVAGPVSYVGSGDEEPPRSSDSSAAAPGSAAADHAPSQERHGGLSHPLTPGERSQKSKIAFLRTRLPGADGRDPVRRARRMDDEASVTAIPLFGQAAPELRLRLLYRLTPAESRIAVSLARGRSLQDAANRLEIRVATVRTHLSRIYDKTGTSRQSELVALLLSGPARLDQT